MNWYYVEQGQQTGPVSEEQLAELVRTGKINAETLVWREGMVDWLPLSQAKSEASLSGLRMKKADMPESSLGSLATGKTAEAVCIECGKIFPIDEMIQHGNARICASCKPVFMQKLAEGARINTGELNYAGFGIRFGAKFLDGLILGVPFFVVFLIVIIPTASTRAPEEFSILPALLQFGFMAVHLAYQIFFLGKYGATPGKMICKLKVVTSAGEPINYARATGRAFAEILSGMICYIGYIMAAFDGQKRALHDHMCNTRVVMK